MVQWLELGILTARVPRLIPSQGTKIPHAAWHDLKKRKSHTQSTLGTKDLAEECQTASFIQKTFIIAFSVGYFINIC